MSDEIYKPVRKTYIKFAEQAKKDWPVSQALAAFETRLTIRLAQPEMSFTGLVEEALTTGYAAVQGIRELDLKGSIALKESND